MSLKSQSDRPPLPLPSPPSWGDLAEPGEIVGCLRFECGEAAYTYPYHTLARWTLRPGSEDSLEILAGTDVIMIKGRGLNAVQQALECTRLSALRETGDRYNTSPDSVSVARIEIRPARAA